MKTITLTIVLALGALPSSTAAQARDGMHDFVGTWRLVSWPQRRADGTTSQSRQSVAYLIYTDNNHVCYVNMDPNRPKWSSPAAPTGPEAMSGIMGFGAYCATVEIHATEGFVLHRVEIDRSPNSVGMVRKRWFTFDGPNRLSLRVDTPELNPPLVESTLIWERVTR